MAPNIRYAHLYCLAHTPSHSKLIQGELVLPPEQMEMEEEEVSITLEDFHPCLAFIKADVFARYQSWRYKKPDQKNRIGIQVSVYFLVLCSINICALKCL